MAICKSILELIFSSVYTIFSIRSLFVYPIINNDTIFRIINNTIVTFVHSSNFEYNKSKATINLCLFQHDSRLVSFHHGDKDRKVSSTAYSSKQKSSPSLI